MRYALPLFLSLCACQRTAVQYVDIDPAFQGYVNEFLNESVVQGHPVVINNLIIHFTNELTAETLGECRIYADNSPNEILIDAQDWQYESDIYRKTVIFHELGHCVLSRGHVLSGNIYSGVCSATSIMWPYIENATNMYTENWNTYMHEMFTQVITASPCSFNNYWGGI